MEVLEDKKINQLVEFGDVNFVKIEIGKSAKALGEFGCYCVSGI